MEGHATDILVTAVSLTPTFTKVELFHLDFIVILLAYRLFCHPWKHLKLLNFNNFTKQ